MSVTTTYAASVNVLGSEAMALVRLGFSGPKVDQATVQAALDEIVTPAVRAALKRAAARIDQTQPKPEATPEPVTPTFGNVGTFTGWRPAGGVR